MKSPPSLNPRFTFYYPDGTGRDDYISVNNGGFLRTNKLTRVFNPLISPKRVHHQDLTLPKKPLNQYYLSGNGRDLYIYCGNPLNQKYHSHKVNFPQLLRSESTGCIINKPKYPFQLSNKEKELIKQQKIFQSNLLDRIYYKDLEKMKTKYLNSTLKNNSMNSDSLNNTSTKVLTKSSSSIQFKPILSNRKPIRNIRLIKNNIENLKKNVVVSPNENNCDCNLKKNLKKMFNWNHSVQNWNKS